MDGRQIIIKESVAESIAAIAWYIESKGMVATAEKFADDVYDFLINMADKRKSYPVCKEPKRKAVGYKNVSRTKRSIQSYLLNLIQNL